MTMLRWNGSAQSGVTAYWQFRGTDLPLMAVNRLTIDGRNSTRSCLSCCGKRTFVDFAERPDAVVGPSIR
jgi:hypothetical protein